MVLVILREKFLGDHATLTDKHIRIFYSVRFKAIISETSGTIGAVVTHVFFARSTITNHVLNWQVHQRLV